VLVSVLRWAVYALGGYRAGKQLHEAMLGSVLAAPMAFFWRTPSGRVVNRFSSDTGQADDSVPWQLGWFVWCLCTALQSFAVCSVTTPVFMALAAPVMLVYLVVGAYYRYAERDCKRLVQLAQSPLYTHFSESLAGAPSIRAFGSATCRRFEAACGRRVLARNGAFYYMTLVQQFGAMYMDLLGASLVTGGVYFALAEAERGALPKPLAALAISFALKIQGVVSAWWAFAARRSLRRGSRVIAVH